MSILSSKAVIRGLQIKSILLDATVRQIIWLIWLQIIVASPPQSLT